MLESVISTLPVYKKRIADRMAAGSPKSRVILPEITGKKETGFS